MTAARSATPGPSRKASRPPQITRTGTRMRAGGSLTRAEMDQIEQYSPIIDGELGMTCWKGRFSMKRYLGVNLAEV